MVRTGIQFQLTASRRGWRKSREAGGEPMIFQLTASRRGWPGRRHRDKALNHISTHSLTKRLTVRRASNSSGSWKHFNSQPHEEADISYTGKATGKSAFQLTASRRGWRSVAFIVCSSDLFQLTASRRGWQHVLHVLNLLICISTHSLTKRLTYFKAGGKPPSYISTHSLTKRLTCHGTRHRYTNRFQLTASRRGWRSPDSFNLPLCVFQLTASRRGWRD